MLQDRVIVTRNADPQGTRACMCECVLTLQSNDVIANVDFDQMVKETSAILAMTMTYAVPLAK